MIFDLDGTLTLPLLDVLGDYKFDIQAGRAAGAPTALVTSALPDDVADWGAPDLVISLLRALLPVWQDD